MVHVLRQGMMQIEVLQCEHLYQPALLLALFG